MTRKEKQKVYKAAETLIQIPAEYGCCKHLWSAGLDSPYTRFAEFFFGGKRETRTNSYYYFGALTRKNLNTRLLALAMFAELEGEI